MSDRLSEVVVSDWNWVGSKIMYLEAFGQSIVVINDLPTAQELLEKRSTIYSSRRVIFIILLTAQLTQRLD